MEDIVRLIFLVIAVRKAYVLFTKDYDYMRISKIPMEAKETLKNQMPHRVYGEERSDLLKPNNRLVFVWIALDIFLTIMSFSFYLLHDAEHLGLNAIGFLIAFIPFNIIFFFLWRFDNTRFQKHEKIYLMKAYVYRKNAVKHLQNIGVAYYDFLNDCYVAASFYVETPFKAKDKTDCGSYVDVYVVMRNNKLKFLKSEFSEINQLM